ncbi:hypothetical protein CMEL01_04044 [Colletotrichum melonis]|uniref:Uncharacterized protein n=1 Tax=Colletotrichum melonis TaxID=1209925 RepID=A0AAI9UBI9_9PEZI|nr:hypothetical protein CMEL01_04044 [Colletotrichum melonis]
MDNDRWRVVMEVVVCVCGAVRCCVCMLRRCKKPTWPLSGRAGKLRESGGCRVVSCQSGRGLLAARLPLFWYSAIGYVCGLLLLAFVTFKSTILLEGGRETSPEGSWGGRRPQKEGGIASVHRRPFQREICDCCEQMNPYCFAVMFGTPCRPLQSRLPCFPPQSHRASCSQPYEVIDSEAIETIWNIVAGTERGIQQDSLHLTIGAGRRTERQTIGQLHSRARCNSIEVLAVRRRGRRRAERRNQLDVIRPVTLAPTCQPRPRVLRKLESNESRRNSMLFNVLTRKTTAGAQRAQHIASGKRRNGNSSLPGKPWNRAVPCSPGVARIDRPCRNLENEKSVVASELLTDDDLPDGCLQVPSLTSLSPTGDR